MIATTTYPSSVRYEVRFAERATPPAVITGEDVDAISMPAAFAALVQAELDIMMLAGPVVADDDGLWTFLTERGADRPVMPSDLLPLGVRPVPGGTPLPAADRPDRPAAIWWNVIGAARRVAHRTSLRA